MVVPFFGDQTFWGMSLVLLLSSPPVMSHLSLHSYPRTFVELIHRCLDADIYPIGEMIHRAGAGPEPIPHKELNVQNLTEGIKFAISPAAKTAAQTMAEQIRSEVSEPTPSFTCLIWTMSANVDSPPDRMESSKGSRASTGICRC